MTEEKSNEWYLARDKQQFGPLSDREIKTLIDLGHLRPDDLLWHEGMTEWVRSDSVFLSTEQKRSVSQSEAPVSQKPPLNATPTIPRSKVVRRALAPNLVAQKAPPLAAPESPGLVARLSAVRPTTLFAWLAALGAVLVVMFWMSPYSRSFSAPLIGTLCAASALVAVGSTWGVKGICLLRYPMLLGAGSLAVAVVVFPPPEAEIVAHSVVIQLPNGARPVALARHQRSVVVSQKLPALPLFPTSFRYYYLDPETKEFWQIKPEFQSGLEEKYRSSLATAWWRYYQFSFAALSILATLFGARYLGRLTRDERHWQDAQNKDTFSDYHRFLTIKEYSRTKYFRDLATNELHRRRMEFAAYLSIVTRHAENAPLREWLIDSIKNWKHGERLELTIFAHGNIAKESIHTNIQSQIANLQQGSDKQNEALNNLKEYQKKITQTMKVKELYDHIGGGGLVSANREIVRVLEGFLNEIVGDHIVHLAIVDNKMGANLVVDYDVIQTDDLYSSAENDRPLIERDVFRRLMVRGVAWHQTVGAKRSSSIAFTVSNSERSFMLDSSSSQSASIEYRDALSYCLSALALEVAALFGLKARLAADGDVEKIDDLEFIARDLIARLRKSTGTQLREQAVNDFVIDNSELIERAADAIARRLGRLEGVFREQASVAIGSVIGGGVLDGILSG